MRQSFTVLLVFNCRICFRPSFWPSFIPSVAGHVCLHITQTSGLRQFATDRMSCKILTTRAKRDGNGLLVLFVRPTQQKCLQYCRRLITYPQYSSPTTHDHGAPACWSSDDLFGHQSRAASVKWNELGEHSDDNKTPADGNNRLCRKCVCRRARDESQLILRQLLQWCGCIALCSQCRQRMINPSSLASSRPAIILYADEK